MDPLSYEVWISFLVCIPAYIGAMVLMNYLYSGNTDWEEAASVVIRNALSECNITKKSCKQLYQRLLVLVWSWMMVVLISAYTGDLVATITKPTMIIPFTNAEGMVGQSDIKWIFEQGLFPSYAKNKSTGTTLRKIYEEAINSSTSAYCEVLVKKYENVAAICDRSSATTAVASSFSKTGTCNYYFTSDMILAFDSALVFQVS